MEFWHVTLVRITLSLVKEHFFWPRLTRDVKRHVRKYSVCHIVKVKGQNSRLYTPLPVPEAPWINVSMDFVADSLGFRGTSIL